MLSPDVFHRLKYLFDSAPKEGKHTNGKDEFRTDSAIGLSLQDIMTSEASDSLKSLLRAGFSVAGGEMTLIITHQVEDIQKGEQYTLELSGHPPGYNSDRMGADFTVELSTTGEVKNIMVHPVIKVWKPFYVNLFYNMQNRTEDIVSKDALALIALGQKALGLPYAP